MTRFRRFAIAVLAAATVTVGSIATVPTASAMPMSCFQKSLLARGTGPPGSPFGVLAPTKRQLLVGQGRRNYGGVLDANLQPAARRIPSPAPPASMPHRSLARCQSRRSAASFQRKTGAAVSCRPQLTAFFTLRTRKSHVQVVLGAPAFARSRARVGCPSGAARAARSSYPP